jgi:hypothetical protein
VAGTGGQAVRLDTACYLIIIGAHGVGIILGIGVRLAIVGHL